MPSSRACGSFFTLLTLLACCPALSATGPAAPKPLSPPSAPAPRSASAAIDEGAARFAIESVLRDLASACIAGDADAYLKHISARDIEFLNEQRYFARDLKKKPAAECSWTIDELTFDAGAASAKLTIEWRMTSGKARSVSFLAAFEPAHTDAGDTWTYAGEIWTAHAAPGVLVLHDPGLAGVASRIAEAFSEVRATVEEGFMLTEKALPGRTQKIKLYSTMRHLQASICLSYIEGLSGWNEPGEAIKILTSERATLASLRSLIAHEYGHVATFELGPLANTMPWWLLEGVAELSAERWGRKPDGMVKAWATHGRLAPWNELADFETVPAKWRGHVYTQGHHMLGYISETFGREKRVQWMTALATGSPLVDATTQAFAITFDELASQWRATLPAQDPEQKKQENTHSQ